MRNRQTEDKINNLNKNLVKAYRGINDSATIIKNIAHSQEADEVIKAIQRNIDVLHDELDFFNKLIAARNR